FPEGSYTLTATAYDGRYGAGNIIGVTSIQFSIVPGGGGGNLPPAAIASATPLNGDVPLDVSFTGSNSTDDSGIDTYAWDFGDGNGASVANPSHTYTTAGIFTATLTVTDQEGLENQTTIEITVEESVETEITSFTLIDATSNSDLLELSEGLEIPVSVTQGIDLSIRANASPSGIGSVGIELTGPVSQNQIEGSAPYALFGNTLEGGYNGVPFPTGSYTISAIAYDESNGAGNILSTLSLQFTVVPDDEPFPALLRINSGGGNVSFGETEYLADDLFKGNGKSFVNNSITDILDTQQDAIYLSERSTTSNLGSFSYNIPVTTGNYRVVLHFAEIYWGATGGGEGGTGKRVFDVSIEGQPVLADFDLNELVDPMTAVTRSFETTVTDGELTIDFSASVNQPKVSAIEIFGDGEVIIPTDPCQWDQLASSNLSKVEAQSVKLNNKLYVLAGFLSGLKITAETEIYDPITNSWSVGAPMPTAVTHMGAVGVGDEIWILAGFAGNHPGVATNKVQVYNTITDSWSEGPPLPNPRGSGTAAYSNGKIHFFGGLLPDRVTDVGEHYILDVNNQGAGWVAAAPMPNPRNHLSAAAVNGMIYAIGGQYGHDNGVQDQAFMDQYNPITDTWTRKASLPSARSHFEPGTLVHNNKIIIVGGRRGGFFFDDVTQYDPITDQWTELCELPSNLLAPAAKVFGDRLIVANGGENGTCCPKSTTLSIQIEPEIANPDALNVLVYHETNEFRHTSIPAGIEMFNDFASTLGWTLIESQNSAIFNNTDLSGIDVVVWLNTSGNGLLTSTEQEAFETFIRNGGGFVGIHAATDTYRDGTWPWYNELVGGIVQGGIKHTANNTNATMDVVGTHPTVAHLGATWNKDEEYYYWQDNGGYLFPGNTILLNVRSTGSNNYDASRPITWFKNYDGGHSFYTALGHNASDYTDNSNFRTMISQAIIWAAKSDSQAARTPIQIASYKNQDNSIRIFPNPIEEEMVITASEPQQEDSGVLTLFSMNGNMILQQEIKGNSDRINMGFLPTGYYIAVMKFKNVVSEKVVFKK
ncbi:ThuA domain-containing protein, partial [Robiginitalea aurantiaca]